MEIGTITLSFDDARKDTYHVFKDILEPLGLPAVVYVPSGFVENSFNDPAEIGYNGLMTKDDLDYANKNSLFEISGHGYMHQNDFEDIRLGLDKIRMWYPDIKHIGLASPHSSINKTYVMQNTDVYKSMRLEYVRGGRNFEKYTSIKRAISLIARVTKSPSIFCYCYKNSTNKDISYYLHAIPVHKLTTLNQIKAIVDYCAKNKCWAILEFHGIDKKESKEYSEEFCWLEDDFIELCHYIKGLEEKRLIQIKTPISMFEVQK